MADLILHIGPGKCGSSSIQHFLDSSASLFKESLHYYKINPLLAAALEIAQPKPDICDEVVEYIQQHASQVDVLILSHEYLFQCPNAVRKLLELAAPFVSRSRVIGYSRKTSDYLISAFSQWLFRDPQRQLETFQTLQSHGFDPELFSAVERHLIACTLNEFHSARHMSGFVLHNWHRNYQRLAELLAGLNVELIPGVLPAQASASVLIEDFLEKAWLHRVSTEISLRPQRQNPRFSDGLIQAVDNAMRLGIAVPGPHDNNDALLELSAGLPPLDEIYGRSLLPILRRYIDQYFAESNQKFCKRFAINGDVFASPAHVEFSTVLQAVTQEQRLRSANPAQRLNFERRLSAQWLQLCLQLAHKARRNAAAVPPL